MRAHTISSSLSTSRGGGIRRGLAAAATALLLAAGLTVVSDTVAPVAASAAQDPTSCQGTVALTNGGFEQPRITLGGQAMLTEAQVPGWGTNDSKKQIEIWSTGFNGVPAAVGTQFAELNANSASMLFQDVATTPGQTLSWSLKHRGRNGVDVMRVMIGAPTGTLVQNGPNLTDGNTAWGSHSGTYTVPAGQTTTRFGFEAVSATGGSTQGNFLDDINFGTGPCLISTKAVTNLSRGGSTAEVGDTLRYTVSTRNDGGNPALQSVSTDILPVGVDFVPGSIRITAGAGAGTLTDATGDDRGEYTAGARTVRVRLGDAGSATVGGSIGVGTTTSYTFDAKVRTSAAATTIVNEAQVAFRDAVANQNRTSTTQQVLTPVNPAADLAITKTLDTSPLVAGQPVAFTLTATNLGPQTATGVTVTDVVPAGLTNVQATSATASCTVGATITCTVPDLAVGATAQIQLTATLSPGFDPGSALTNTASIRGTRTDPNPANNTATASGTLSTVTDVSIDKQFAPTDPVAGDPVTYTLTVTNSGPSEARDVTITDPLDPATTFISSTVSQGACTFATTILTCAVGTLAPGASAVATVTVGIAANATGLVQNTSTVTTSTPDSNPDNNVDNTAFEPDIIADLQVTKSASVAQVAAGGTVDFTLVVNNKGDSVAQNAVLVDTLPAGFEVDSISQPAGVTCGEVAPGTVRCQWPTLAVNQPQTIVIRTVVAADAPVGTALNTTSVASPALDADTSDNSAQAEVEIVQSADVSIVKTAAGNPVPGGAYEYTLTILNDGPSTARGVTVSDPMPVGFTATATDGDCTIVSGVVDCTLGDLAPDETVVIHITGTWSSEATGSVSNTATVDSVTPDADTSNNTSTVTKSFAPLADVSVTKTTSTPAPYLGGPVSFLVTVRNDGPSVAAGVRVEELPETGILISGAQPSAGQWLAPSSVWAVGTLKPGQSETLTVTGTTSAIGTLTNLVRASSLTPDVDTNDLEATADVVVSPAADLSIVKTSSANPAPLNGAITYTLLVENHGPSAATALTIADALPAALQTPTTTTPGCTIVGGQLTCLVATLAVGGTTTVTVSGTVDPSMTASTLSNTATVTSTTIDPVPGNNTSTVTVPVSGTPRVQLEKRAGVATDTTGDGRIGVGDTVAYTFTIHNTGDVTLTSAAITDPLLGGAVPCAEFAAPLLPGASVVCAPVSYTLTQPDADEGTVHNTATVLAQSARGTATDDAEANVTIAASKGISLRKVPGTVTDVDQDGAVGEGDTVSYVFTVTNNGTTTLRNAKITDAMLGGDVVCPELDGVVLAPGQPVTCAPIVYTLTQDDIDDGLVHNEASVIANAPTGTVTDNAQADVDITGTAAIELHKNVGRVLDTTNDGVIGEGDTVEYSFTAYNRGTTTLTNVRITDSMLGSGNLCELGALAVDGSADCGVFEYTLTQSDVENNIVRNIGRVDGVSPLGPVWDEAGADVVIAGVSAIELTKTPGAIDLGADGRVGKGDTVGYTFTIHNSGTTILRDIVLDDPLLGGVVDCPALDGLELVPGDDVDCGPIPYVLTQEDVDAGTVHNEATVVGQSRGGPAEDDADADVRVAGTDEIQLLKSAAAVVDANDNGRTDAGDTLAYTFTVTNTGTTTLSDVTVSDPRLSGDIVCDTTELAPGEATVCAGEPAVLTQAEIDAGEIVNTATATGTGTSEIPPTDEDTVVTPLIAQPAIALVKTAGGYADADGNGKVDAGDTVDFRFTVTNTGAVTLTDIVLDDPKLGGEVACDIPDLAPGASADCGPVAYTLTAADVAAGKVVNVATVSGVAGAVTVTAAATATVDVSGLATTGGVITGIGWALALLAIGLLVLLIARVRRRDAAA